MKIWGWAKWRDLRIDQDVESGQAGSEGLDRVPEVCPWLNELDLVPATNSNSISL